MTPIVCVLFARTQLKQEGFFASNSKYVVCFTEFFAGKDFCDISTFCEFNMLCNLRLLKCDMGGLLW